jgi:hypothetical protein
MFKKEYEKPIIDILEVEDEMLLENSGEINFDQLLGLEGDDEEFNDLNE